MISAVASIAIIRGRRFAIAAVVLAAIALIVIVGTSPFLKPSRNPTTLEPKPTESVGPLVARMEAAVDRDQIDLAQELVAKILSVQPDHGKALLYRGQFARDRGETSAALADWKRIGDDPPMIGATARYLEGSIALEQGRARDAERLFRRAAELNPRYLQPQARLLELYVVQARRDDIRRQIARVAAFRQLTLHEYVFRLVPPERANTADSGASIMRISYERDSEDIESALALGLYLIEGERHAEAEEVLQGVFEKQPENERAAALLAMARLRQGQIDQARQVLTSFSLRPTSASALWKSAAWLAEAERDWAKAAEYFQQVVELEPEDSVSLYRLGVVTQLLGQPDVARAILERAAKLDHMQRQALRLVWGKRDQPELILPIIVEVGQGLLELGYTQEAARWFQQALNLHPAEPAALAGMQRAMQDIASQANDAVTDPFGPRERSETRSLQVASPDRTNSKLRKQSLETASSSTSATIVLQDRHREAGLDFTYFNGDTGFKHLVESMGGGIAVLDFDADGRPDFYFPQGCAIPPDPNDQTHLDRLFRNNGNGKFADVTEKTGIVENRYGQGIAVGDYDADGFDDVLIANYGRNRLWHNNGDGTFVDRTASAGLAGPEEMSSSAAFADLDFDGHLDLYIANYVTSLKVCQDADGSYHSCSPTNFDAMQDRLYRSRGDGTFEDVTTTAGVIAPDGKGLGVVVADFDDDGRPDLYVANDTTPNFLFRNQSVDGSLKFTEDALIAGVALSGEGRAQAGMGIASGDFNNDGRIDLHVTNFYQETNALYVNLGEGAFADSTRTAGLAEPSFAVLGFGTQAADFDLDGDQDLFVANGHIDDFRSRGEPWKMPPQLYANDGDARFTDVSKASSPYFAGEYLGRGVARLDYDSDGRLDLAVVHQDRPVGLLHNETQSTAHVLALDLHGRASNRDAIGAKIIVTAGGRVQTLQLCGGDGFFSANEKRQFVGLGSATEVDSVEIRWPNGSIERWHDLPANIRVVCVEGQRPKFTSLNRRHVFEEVPAL